MTALLQLRSGFSLTGRIAVLALFVLCFLSEPARAQPDPGFTVTESSPTLVTTESAEYRGRIHGKQIVEGKLALTVVRRGEGSAVIDWSDVNIAMNHLSWEKQALIAGTSPEQRVVLVTQRESDVLNGDWSANGKQIGQTTIFDLRFPPALNNRIQLDVPLILSLSSNQGLLQAGDAHDDGLTRPWTLELGGISTVTLMITATGLEQKTSPPRYETETEHRARRDGIFMRTDFAITGPLPHDKPLVFHVPETLEIQSITHLNSSPTGSSAIAFSRNAENPQLVQVQLDSLASESRLNLRIRSFEPVKWSGPRVLPRIRIEGAMETKRGLVLRIEPPLQLQEIEHEDLLQTGLTSDETGGESWRFEARNPNSELTVNIGLPDAPLHGDIVCLTDARPDAGWTAAVATLHIDDGSRFDTTIQLPDDWRLISVSSSESESRIASWNVDDHVLYVTWQNALSRGIPRQLRLFARTTPHRERTPFRISVPQIRGSKDIGVQYQLVLPNNSELQLLEGDGWRLNEGTQLLPALIQLKEVTERLPESTPRQLATLTSNGSGKPSRVLANLIPRAESAATLSLVDTVTQDAEGRPTTNDPAQPTVPSPPQAIASLDLLTMAGQTHQQECVNHAALTFDRPVKLDALKLRLPPGCRLSAMKLDDRSITVFRRDEEISIPAEITTASTIRLTYVTPSVSSTLKQHNIVPLPETTIPFQSFRWSLDLPAVQQLSGIKLPGMYELGSPPRKGPPRMFGPLSRQASDLTFNPFSSESWTQLRGVQARVHKTVQSRRTWTFVSPIAGGTAEFVTWNVAVTRSYSWVALLGCLLLGLIARLFRMLWLRKIAILWVAFLILVVSQSPPNVALIFGGMLSGSLLSLVIPRRWIQRTDLLARKSESIRGPATVATTLLLLSLGPVQNVMSDIDQPTSEIVTSSPEPTSLIRSVRYDLVKGTPVVQLAATFEILTRQTEEEQFLRLPMQDIVFPAEAECLLNGTPRPLIPARSGESILVSLGKPGEFPGTPISGTHWSRHEIRFNFSIRSRDTGIDGQTLMTRGVVPRVLDSELIIPKEFIGLQWQRNGEVAFNADGTSLVELGSIGLLELMSPIVSTPNVPQAQSLHSYLDVSALRVRCQTRIQPLPTGWPELLPIKFPPGTTVTGITGSNLIDWVDTSTTDNPMHITLRLRSGMPANSILLTYDFQASSTAGTDVTIPPLSLLSTSEIPHYIGISSPPLTTLTIPNRVEITPLSIEEWQQHSELGRLRPMQAVLLSSPVAMNLEWVRKKPIRTANTVETLKVRRDSLDYSATVSLSVSDAPTFRHQFLLDPIVQIENISTGLMGNDGSVRFTRANKLVTVYLGGGQQGERTFHIRGRIPFNVEVWSPIPRIEPVDTIIADTQLTISDETNWDVELEGDQGLLPLATPDRDAVQEKSPRVIGVYRGNSNDAPKRLRLITPARAFLANIITLVKTPMNRDWDQVSTVHMTSPEAPLRKIVFKIPNEITAVRVRPALFHHSSQQTADGTLLTVRVPDRYSGAATLTLAGRYTAEYMNRVAMVTKESQPIAVPQIEVVSAVSASQYILVESEALFQPLGATRVARESLPNWLPPEWMRDLSRGQLSSFELPKSELRLQRREKVEAGGEPVVHLAETILWPLQDQSIRGLTRWWISPNGAAQIRVRHPNGTVVENVTLEGAESLKFKNGARETLITLPQGQDLSGINIYWSGKEAEGTLSLLDTFGPEPFQNLVALIHPQGWKIRSTSASTTSSIAVWMARWDQLLGLWNEAGHTQPMTTILMDEINKTQEMVGELVSQNNASAENRNRYAELAERWKELNSRSPVTPQALPQRGSSAGVVLTQLIAQPEAAVQVDWILPDHSNWTARFSSPNSGIQWPSLVVAILVLSGLAWVLVRFSRQFAIFREFASSHTQWSFTVLGLIWWQLLSPSVVGLLIIIVTCTIAWGRRLAKKIYEDSELAPSTASPNSTVD
ncbi:hypothetical protein [Planctomicrobium sp. SH527]|uniref:hypothetical protein n=1 Tax=Planctomicrobium sp. SH527 TaxID=3448123 RepID=UPI003F5B43FE